MAVDGTDEFVNPTRQPHLPTELSLKRERDRKDPNFGIIMVYSVTNFVFLFIRFANSDFYVFARSLKVNNFLW